MIEAFVYPVSAVLKFWHWLLAGVFDVQSSQSWVASVILLVVTLRALITPLQWYSYKTSRLLVLMRPRLLTIKLKSMEAVTPESVQELEDARKQVHKDHRYNPFAGCLPALIQLPVFLGLYRLLLWMAVPESSAGRSLGVLSSAEVESFRTSTLMGVPLPAYMSMSGEQFQHLGTSLESVRALAVPMLVTAVLFTTLNMVISQARTRSTLEWENPVARRLYAFVWILIPLAAIGITTAGLTGLVPIALLLYWVSGNSWTFIQTMVLWYLTIKAFPLEPHHREHLKVEKEKELTRRAEVRKKKRQRRKKRFSVVSHPSSFLAVRRELAEEKMAEKNAQAQEKTHKKEVAQQRAAARREANTRKQAEAAQARTQKAPKDEQPAAKSSNPPAVPPASESQARDQSLED